MATGLKKLAKENPEFGNILAPFIKQAENVANTVREGVKDKEEEQKEFARKENLYLSLMSLQDYAAELAHGIRFANTPVLHAAELFLEYYPNPKYEELFKKYPKIIHNGATQIKHLVDTMLSYSKIELEDVTFSVKDFLDYLLLKSQRIVFDQEKINVQIDVLKDIELTGNKKFLEDVLTNLISNSIKALKNTENKIIKCEVYTDTSNLYISFSDNGCGVPDKVKLSLFEMFKTTTADEGGAGLGLYIARTRMAALHGTIELVPSVFNHEGATFKITLPLKK
jgi:signal transduction histidine kinase